ncbi:chemotaxis protein CheX [Metabacillus sp. KIGAM252]|uniref:Chemotaxis protein CheX n=1 Tax=Metabacillus flavus TaxID=2823519 RepID=A0ABS5LG35_9BACI|nr:chemotaxis protein CheX [Metabacillus flavus]MBS2969349.1 chemotaxis protein CheX [Metabacillus flavus]
MTEYTYDLIITSTFESIKTMIPGTFHYELENSRPLMAAVQVGIIGEVKGSLLIEGNEDVFKDFGLKLYGMALEGEMLSSFIGEFANMVAGQMATHLSSQGMNLDITPPKLLADTLGFAPYTHKQEGPLKVSFSESSL